MNLVTPALPVKTREMHNHHFDSTMWNGFSFRDDDVIIASYAKSGTTWLQQIVAQLIFNGDVKVPVGEMSPWVDLRVPPREVKLPAIEAQSHRRSLKTHLPVDALNFSPRAKYIYIARDGRDVVWSLYNHHVNANAAWYGALNETPGLVGDKITPPTKDVVPYFRDWLTNDGQPFWSLWENMRSWWNIRGLGNVLMVHYADLKRDMEGEMRRIAAFLDLDPQNWPAILEHCSFPWMKAHAADSAPLGGAFWEGGAETFIHKGTNGRWQGQLTAEDVAAYEARALAELGPDCAAWLAGGRGVKGLTTGPAAPR